MLKTVTDERGFHHKMFNFSIFYSFYIVFNDDMKGEEIVLHT
jgi:hypothetical protein